MQIIMNSEKKKFSFEEDKKMKKLKVLLGAIALIASMTLVGCNQPAGSGAGADTGGAEETTWDGVIDLTGKTVKNASAFANAYGGFVIDFGRTVDVSQYSKLEVSAKFYDENNDEITAAYGLGQFIVLDDPAGDWQANAIKTQYNLGIQNWDPIDTENLASTTAKALVVQNSSKTVKYIEVTEIKFVK